ncbi:CinA family protein [Campylobacter aviculae]|uniref:CinA family protein n=1 Tax=Campylobacter aviculae TaxID=2510190 RepID=A0A4U7BRV5_9BACT|nr:CinA family protein [Campylobacter aviculae]TKX33120.1 CinA family protein [Campylobacter aviculae]
MRHLLFLVGDELEMNDNFRDYIYRSYKKKFKEICEIRFQNKTDKELPFLLEKLLMEYDFITLFTTPNHYATIAKILATLNEDALVLKEDNLVPDKAYFSKDSFICDFIHSKINVIKATIGQKLPEILGDIKPNFTYFCLFGIDDESAVVLLDTLTKSYEVEIKSSKILENLTLIKATCASFGKLDGFLTSVKNLFGQKIFLGKDPIELIVSKLLEKNLKISFAESCTGGLCASTLTQFSGVSQIFEGSIVSYSNRIKHEWLGISESYLQDGKEYSERCVYFMLKGVFKTAKPDFALAISGVAGENDEGLVKSGTIYIGAMFKDGTFVQETLYLDGDRKLIQKQAMIAAFCLLLKLKPEIFEF